MSRRVREINQSAEKLRLRGLRLAYIELHQHKPLSGKTSYTIETPSSIDRAVATAVRYGRENPTSYQPSYRINVYLK